VLSPRAHLLAAPLLLALLGSCGRKSSEPPAPPTHLVGALAFHEDRYDLALAEARRRNLPLFVDAWAPWCHTCLSLRSQVLADPSLAPLAGRFVWLSVDTERAQNQPFLARFPLLVWPTLWVIDPRDERPLLRWPGALNRDELRQLLDDASAAFHQGHAARGQAAAALLLAERAAAEGKAEEAIRGFREAIAAAPEGWGLRPRASDGLVTALREAKKYDECAAASKEELPRAGRGTSAANVALLGLLCARKLGDRPRIDEAARAVEQIARDPSRELLPDDRSSLHEELVFLRKEQGDREGSRAQAAAWSAYLEEQAAKARTPEERRVFDAHRMVAFLELERPEQALALVEQSAREQPEDYNHPARLAKIHLTAGRTGEALAAIDRALALAYGPRRLRLFDLKARILEKRGDGAAARAALEQGVREGEAMKLEGKQAQPLDALRARLPR
jgi:thioredoxin-like negative regulator of GroEL